MPSNVLRVAFVACLIVCQPRSSLSLGCVARGCRSVDLVGSSMEQKRKRPPILPLRLSGNLDVRGGRDGAWREFYGLRPGGRERDFCTPVRTAAGPQTRRLAGRRAFYGLSSVVGEDRAGAATKRILANRAVMSVHSERVLAGCRIDLLCAATCHGVNLRTWARGEALANRLIANLAGTASSPLSGGASFSRRRVGACRRVVARRRSDLAERLALQGGRGRGAGASLGRIGQHLAESRRVVCVRRAAGACGSAHHRTCASEGGEGGEEIVASKGGALGSRCSLEPGPVALVKVRVQALGGLSSGMCLRLTRSWFQADCQELLFGAAPAVACSTSNCAAPDQRAQVSLREMKVAFCRADAEGNGSLTLAELSAAMSHLGRPRARACWVALGREWGAAGLRLVPPQVAPPRPPGPLTDAAVLRGSDNCCFATVSEGQPPGA